MAQFTLRKKFTFEAAHFLPHSDGKCRRLHGHSWVGWAEVEADSLHNDGPQAGMVIDFAWMASMIKPMVDTYLDHYLLNESLAIESPTSEAVAEWIFNHLRDAGLDLATVTIEETCTSVCTYRA